ncbi:MAG: tail fiber domain-containing protein, partial [Candidatus Puniceispirillaceae bacterium]
ARTNATLALQSRALDDALALANYSGQQALYGIITKVDLAELQAGLTEMGFEVQRDLAELDAETQRYVAELTRQWRAAQGNDARQGAILELVGSMITAYATISASDYRMKREIRAADSQVEGFLDALNAYQYEYKDPHAPGADAGLFVGVMAQDLEKTPMGASFVKDTPQGKMVDYGHGLAAILASQSNIHDRLRRLEEG